MISKRVDDVSVKSFHETFPYALEWFIPDGKKKQQHNAYFPYDDYRDRYAKKLKGYGAIGIRKFKTKSRETN
jgi:hypothetical protein